MFSHIFIGTRSFGQALAHGGRCDGAYFRDLDGNKLCVACHEAPSP